MRFLIFTILAVFLASSVQAKERYDGHKVYRITPRSEEQRNYLKDLQDVPELDFWTEVSPAQPADVMVKPEHQKAFLETLEKAGLEAVVYVDDVQQRIDNEVIGQYSRAGMTWTAYHTLEDIYSWFDDLAAANPGKVTIIQGGSTYENRTIKGLKISFGTGKRAVFFEGGIHAREWISPATVTYIANELLTSTDPAFRKIAQSFDWYLFPVTNPDGFVYTHTNSRLWRKTRTPYGLCSGADPNRNWDAHWMEQGSSSSACSDTYGGPKVFSERSTSTLSSFIKTIGASLDAYIDFHSYSQFLLIPYGHTTEHLDNYDDTLAIGKKAIEALAKRYGTKYIIGNIAETIYPATGGSIDWVKQEFRTPIVYAYELRDTGRDGFILPAIQIIPNCLEVVDSLIAMFEEAEKMGYWTLG